MLAKEALAQPQSRDAFEYGRVVGMYAGLERAVNVLFDLIKEDEERGLKLLPCKKEHSCKNTS